MALLTTRNKIVFSHSRRTKKIKGNTMFNMDIKSILGCIAVAFTGVNIILAKLDSTEANHGMYVANMAKCSLLSVLLSAGVIVSLFVLDSPSVALALVFIYCVLWIVVFAVKSGAPSRLEIVALLLDGMLLMGAVFAFIAWFSGAYS